MRRRSLRSIVLLIGALLMAEVLAPGIAEALPNSRRDTTLTKHRARPARRQARCRNRRTCRRSERRTRARSAPLPPAGPRSVVIDISDQRLYQFENGMPIGELPVSTGTGRPYRSGGRTYIGHTPRGNFRVGRKIEGWRTSRLGRLYFPSYFVGGYAIHGGQLPGYPASHGCVRIPMPAAQGFYHWAVPGTGVTVQD